MARIRGVFKAENYPYPLDAAAKNELDELFAYLFPDGQHAEIDQSHIGVAIAAQNPRLALLLTQLSRFMALDMQWCRRADLRELAIQTVNVHFRSDYSFKTRSNTALACGVSMAQQQAIADWQRTDLFTADQKLVIEYANAVVRGGVDDQLYARVQEAFGEKGVVEMTGIIGFWSFWAMFLNATHTSAVAT
jgi:4-carboxymuconolactone decarboxylase